MFMNVLIDANVVFDVVEKRQTHYAASNQVLCLCRRRVLAGMVAYHTIANSCFAWQLRRYGPRPGRCWRHRPPA